MKINNIHDLAEHFGTTPEHLEHYIYKYTDCGAWINWTYTKVSIGSIVEGSDAEFDETFEFPFDSEEVDDWLEEQEYLTTAAWNEANADDPYDIVMNMTNPGLDLTFEEAEDLIAQAEADGWSLPLDFDAEMFLEIYHDLEPEEEDE